MFSPGESGNPLGRAVEKKPWLAAINRAIAQEDAKRLRRAVEQLLDQAAAGEPWAIQELANRLDGKPAQAITGADGGPIQFSDSNRMEIARRIAFILAYGLEALPAEQRAALEAKEVIDAARD